MPRLALLFAVVLVLLPQAGFAEPPAASPTIFDRRAWFEEVRALRAAERSDLGRRVRAMQQSGTSEPEGAQRELDRTKREWRQRLRQVLAARRATGATPSSTAVAESTAARVPSGGVR